MFPDAFFGVYLKGICKQHDFRYSSKSIARSKADKEMFNSIRAETPKIVSFPLACIMYTGIRLVGKPFWDKAGDS